MTISLNVFADDLKLAVFHNYEKVLVLDSTSIDSLNQALIINYITTFFTMSINENKKTPFTYREITYEKDKVWLEIYCKIYESIDRIEFYNAIFTDLFYDQKNLVIFSGAGVEKGMYFDIKDKIKSIDFTSNDFLSQ